MSVMSDLDLLYRDGAVTQNDFIERGISPERAAVFARIVSDTEFRRAEQERKHPGTHAKYASALPDLKGIRFRDVLSYESFSGSRNDK